MKLGSFHVEGRDRIGCEMSDGRLLDLSSIMGEEAPSDMLALILSGSSGLTRIQEAIAEAGSPAAKLFDPNAVTWHPPVRTPSKMVFVALNNRSLDAVKIKAPTDHPAFFLKPHTALIGHGAAIRLRKSYGFTHPEPELAVIIGATLRDVTPEQAMDGVFGYSIMNDVTSVGMREEDSFSLRIFKPDPATGEVAPGHAHTTYPGRYKASDTFAPLGPWLVTRDAIPDPAALTIRCWMDGRLVASDQTRNYTWGVPEALSHISRTMTLLPGDVVSMGTAVGGDADDPDAPEIPGVTKSNINGLQGAISIEISGLGTLSNGVEIIGE
jgi:2-keto-4-pentenoate hydratase/2-oxohepta-3-ene-1,7-dioic acid hydratase in catechol pathway